MSERLRVRDEDGFTLIEVLIATFILVLASIAVFLTFSAAIHNVAPKASAETANPAKRVVGSEFNLKKSGTELAPLAIAGTGVCSSSKPCVNNEPASSCVGGTSPGTFTNGTATGSVYCYVTTLKDKPCEEATGKACTYRRVVVAVWLAKAGNLASRPAYYELQSNVNPPE